MKINSNISLPEMVELNNEDAKKMNLALGIVLEEIPSKVTYIKSKIDEIATKISSFKTIDLGFDIDGDVERLIKDYDTFANNVANYTGYYELDILSEIEFFGKQNSIDGEFRFDDGIFKALPYLATVMFTITGYASNGFSTQLGLDAYTLANGDDINVFGNAAYNFVELVTQRWDNVLRQSAVAASLLIVVESLYDRLVVHKDPRQGNLTIIKAAGNGVKLVADNIITELVAIPVGKTVTVWVTAKIGGSAGAALGGPAGFVVGGGIAIAGSYIVDKIVDPVVTYLQGNDLIPGTSIPRNGGMYSLYSDYERVLSSNSGYGSLGRVTSLYGMNVSSQYCKALLQQDPVGTILGLDNFNFSENNFGYNRLTSYLDELKSISKDSVDFNEQVSKITDKWLMNISVSNGDHVSDRQYDYVQNIIDMGFDPYAYAMDN